MKTAFATGNQWRQIYHTFYYHGILMQCYKPGPGQPYIYIPINPPINPPNYLYPCDGLPETATPPQKYQSSRNTKITASGGLLTAEYQYSVSGGPHVAYKWSFTQPIKIEFEVSFPRLQYAGGGTLTLYCNVEFPTTNELTYHTYKTIKKVGEEWVITESGFIVHKGTTIYYTGAFLSAWRGKLIKNITTGLWDIYLNDTLLVSAIEVNPGTMVWYMAANMNSPFYIDMDYINAWVNIDRIP